MARQLEATDFYLLTKINRLIIPFAAFLLGFLLVGATPWTSVLLPLLSVLFVYASAATVNDVFDVKIDKVSNPERPIASDKIGRTGALVLLLLFAFVGLFIAYWVSMSMERWFFLWLMVIEFFLGLLYSGFLSKHFVTANGTLAFSHGLIPFLAAVFLFNHGVDEKMIIVGAGLWIVLFLTYNLKDLKDVEGDRFERSTLPGTFGLESAKKLNWFFLATPIPIAFLVFFFGKTGYLSLGLTLFFGILLVLLGNQLENAYTKKDLTKILNQYRVLMAFFLLSFAF